MRCKGCDYPLWSIRSRQCPECGLAFAPSEFDFAANAVEFHCPHCDQAYFGTDERGHLSPPEFDCVSCGQRVGMDEMVLLPGQGVREELTSAPILAWLDKRKKRSAAWRVIGMSMAQPRRMMDITPVQSSVGRAWWFYTLVMLMVSILNGIGFLLIGFMGGGRAMAAIFIGLASYVFGVYGWALLWGATAHGLMKLFGAKPQFSIGRTYQGLCYSSGVMFPAAIPCIGFYILPVVSIWWMISAALAIGRAQRARAGRAAIAVLVLPGLLFLGGGGFIGYHLVSGVSTAMRMSSTSTAQFTATNAYLALTSHAARSGNTWPAHGAELLAVGSLSAIALSLPMTIDRTPQTIGGIRAWQWDAGASVAAQTRADIATAMADALPADWAAHRLGHVVFTYNGVNPGTPQDPGLWLFFYWPDPTDGSRWIPGRQGVAMRADGVTEEFDPSAFDEALADQNALRATHGLPPLPDPSTVIEVVIPPGAAEE